MTVVADMQVTRNVGRVWVEAKNMLRLRSVVLSAAVALATTSIWWELTAYPAHTGRSPNREIAQILSGGSVIVVSAVLARRRPHHRMWRLLLWFGAIGFAQDLGEPNRLLLTIGVVAEPIAAAVFAHMVLAFPTGRLGKRRDRLIVALSYGLSIGEGLRHSMFRNDVGYSGRAGTTTLLFVRHLEAFDFYSARAFEVCRDLLAVALLVAMVRRLIELRQRPSWVRVPLAIATVTGAAVFVSSSVAAAMSPAWHQDYTFWSFLVIQSLIPIVFAAGLGLERRSRSRIADLVVAVQRCALGEVESVLATSTGDPSLRLRFAAPDGNLVWADGSSAPLPAPTPDRSITPIVVDGEAVALIDHDVQLHDQPDFLNAVVATARFAVENARMQALALARLDELRQSRQRVVDAADTERRRIERNLHDGAQQQLIALGMRVDHLRRQASVAGVSDLERELTGVVADLRSTLVELQGLSRGIHPAILTSRGLVPALRSLAERSPIPVRLVATHRGRYPEVIEATAYYVAAEGLANALRHSSPEMIAMKVERVDRRLRVTVEDDGIGGADPLGSGLRGLADRVMAVGGQFSVGSPPSGGTVLIAELPCE